MTENELKNIIFNFVKLNPKKDTYPKVNKYDSNAFFDVKNLLKNNLQLVNQDNYGDIFSNKNGKFLSGEKWIEDLLMAKNINDYHINIRRKFEKCNQKNLIANISKDLLLIYYQDETTALIEATEINFDVVIRKQLAKIRILLDEKDWSNYFFNLQKLMHEQIIKFLHWKSEKLKYDLYIKTLKKEIKSDLVFNQIKNIIDEINLYRNSLIKVTAGGSKISQDNKNNWNNKNNIEKEIQALDFYYKLILLIDIFKHFNW